MYSTAFLFRIAKATSVAAIGLMGLLIAIGNITDYIDLFASSGGASRKLIPGSTWK
jgi:hypothetical protein